MPDRIQCLIDCYCGFKLMKFIYLPLINFFSFIQSLLQEMQSREEERANLRPLIQSLISRQPTNHKDGPVLLSRLDDLSSNWAKREKELRECQSTLQTAHDLAVSYEGAMEKLLPWVPETLKHLGSLGAIPTEPEEVEKRKREVEVRGEG